jgi:hypothetical protein
MRNKKTHSIGRPSFKRKIFGKRIKKDALVIPDTPVSFFEDVPLYRKKLKVPKATKQTARSRRSKKPTSQR